jgi:2-methylcitrate dehydratase
MHGRLAATDYEDDFAADPRIDRLREKMTVVEEPRYTRDNLDPEKRSKANAIEVRLKGSAAPLTAEVEYPIGHPRRRAECTPILEEKFTRHLSRRYAAKQRAALLSLCADQARLEATPVNVFMDAFAL